MTEGKRQKQVAAVLEQELNEVFRHLGLHMMRGGLVSIAGVKVTPDLLEARVYLSFFQTDDKTETLRNIQEKSREIKKELNQRVRHQLRIMPKLSFFIDDTLEYVDKMEKLFREIKSQEEKKEP